MHKPLVAFGLCVCAIASAACSSTAQQGVIPDPAASEIEVVEAPSSLETFDPQQATESATSVDTASITSVASAPGETASAAESAFVAAAPSTPPAASSRTRKTATFGPGVSERVLRIGAMDPGPYPAHYKALYPETFRPDFKRVWQVVTEAINSTGGTLGRKIEVVLLTQDPNEETADEEICAYFTEEEAVIAVAGVIGEAAPCLDDAGIASLPHSYTLEPDFYRRAPHALAALGISQRRATQLYVEGLYQQGFFDGDHNIGLLRWDNALYRMLADKVMKPTLARHGLQIEEEVVIIAPENQSEGQIAQAQQEGWNGVQAFKDAGVDRVLTLDNGSWLLPEFTKYADQQSYYPRYGLNSLNGGEWDMDRDQLKGAMGIGWMPWVDLEPEDAYRHGSEGARRCHDLLDAAGESKQMDTYNEGIWTSSICDAALLLKAAVEAGGPSITADSIVAGAEQLGTSFQGANTLVTRFGPGRHEGVAAIRFLRWFTACECFRYTSELLDAG